MAYSLDKRHSLTRARGFIITNYSFVAVKIEEPECRVDQDCPSKLACINEQCQNPCRINNPCTGNQECVVKDTLPTRTVACVCPDRMVFTENGNCQAGMT